VNPPPSRVACFFYGVRWSRPYNVLVRGLDDAVQRELFRFQRVVDVDQRTRAGNHVGPPASAGPRRVAGRPTRRLLLRRLRYVLPAAGSASTHVRGTRKIETSAVRGSSRIFVRSSSSTKDYGGSDPLGAVQYSRAAHVWDRPKDRPEDRVRHGKTLGGKGSKTGKYKTGTSAWPRFYEKPVKRSVRYNLKLNQLYIKYP